ncbi:hypothetical protein FACS189490_14100 [Clostridia bacterium]|nr:hypothetical protein FACS189490_14100 [Clostridia bacterium]
MFSCAKSDDYMMKYMDGVLTETEAAELKKHVDTCENCRESFLIYDKLMDGLKEESTESPCEDFVGLVMAKIAALPASAKVNSVSRLENVLYAVFGTLSVILGSGVLVFLSRAQIFAAMMKNETLAPFALALQPLYTKAEEFCLNLINVMGAAFVSAGEFIANYAFVALIAFAVVLGVSYFVTSRSHKAKEENHTEI